MEACMGFEFASSVLPEVLPKPEGRAMEKAERKDEARPPFFIAAPFRPHPGSPWHGSMASGLAQARGVTERPWSIFDEGNQGLGILQPVTWLATAHSVPKEALSSHALCFLSKTDCGSIRSQCQAISQSNTLCLDIRAQEHHRMSEERARFAYIS